MSLMLPLMLLDRRSRDVRELARATMEVDDLAFGPMLDALEESGEPTMLEVGMCYMIKTPTIYYLGRVKRCSYTFVELEHVSEVYDTGKTDTCWRSGKPTNLEHYPTNETVTIPLSSVIAAPSWHKPLPNGGDK